MFGIRCPAIPLNLSGRIKVFLPKKGTGSVCIRFLTKKHLLGSDDGVSYRGFHDSESSESSYYSEYSAALLRGASQPLICVSTLPFFLWQTFISYQPISPLVPECDH
jgi:hypothetical protein